MKKSNKIQWYLKIYPSGCTKEYKDFLSIFLCLKTSNPNLTVHADYHLDLIKENGEKYISENASYTFIESKQIEGYGFFRFVEIKVLKNDVSLLPGNVLTLSCSINTISFTDIKIRTNVMMDVSNKKVNFENEVEKKFENYLELMYGDSRFSDVTLIVNDKELKAHKNVLAIASPIFSSMFENDKLKSVITITDLSYEVAVEMLRFIY